MAGLTIALMWTTAPPVPALAAAASSPTLWYVTRATATAAYVMLSLSVLLGMVRSISRQTGERLTWIVDELHQVVATLALVLVGMHLLSLLLDPFLPFTLTNLLVPLTEPYRPLAARLGVLAVYGMVLVSVSSWLRRRITFGAWRGIHYFSLVTFALATAHGFLAGSDAAEPWMRGLYAGAAGAFVFLLLVRLFAGTPATT